VSLLQQQVLKTRTDNGTATLIEQVAIPLSEEEKETEAITVHLAEELQKTGYALRSKTMIVAVK
jgi:hypothetical protein